MADKASNVSVRLTAEDKTMLEEYAKANDMSMSQVLRKAVREYLERNIPTE